MGFHYFGGASFSLCSRAAVANPLFFCKTNSFFCRTAVPSGDSTSSTSSGGLQWHENPLRRSTRPHIPTPKIRRWIEADQPHLSEERYMVVSYNILGVKNASNHSYLYRKVPFRYLRWEYRKRLLCKELIELNPDIICLQEVDRYFDLLKIMERAGYAGSYKRCTGDKVDGCAIFWRSDRFRLLEYESIEFKTIGLRDNVTQISVFETSNESSRRLLVGNIHVLYNPSRGDIKLGQLRFLLSRAKILAEEWGNIPVVLAGDYNTTPESALYKFLTSSELNIKDCDKRELSGQRQCHPNQVLGVDKEAWSPLLTLNKFWSNGWTEEEVRVATGDTNSYLVKHPLKLKSSYANVKSSTRTRNENGEPKATSYHSKFLGTVDYLWYSDGIMPTRVLDTLPLDVLRKLGSLPCKKLGSDHLALVSEFTFQKEPNKRTPHFQGQQPPLQKRQIL